MHALLDIEQTKGSKETFRDDEYETYDRETEEVDQKLFWGSPSAPLFDKQHSEGVPNKETEWEVVEIDNEQ